MKPKEGVTYPHLHCELMAEAGIEPRPFLIQKPVPFPLVIEGMNTSRVLFIHTAFFFFKARGSNRHVMRWDRDCGEASRNPSWGPVLPLDLGSPSRPCSGPPATSLTTQPGACLHRPCTCPSRPNSRYSGTQCSKPASLSWVHCPKATCQPCCIYF